jgi:C1A family cysteine protease
MTSRRESNLRILGVLLFAAVIALALFSSALSSAPPPEPPPPTEIRLGVEDNGRQVQLREGEALVISLEANPSTGYGWEEDSGPGAMEAEPILVQTAEEFQAQQALVAPNAGAEEATPPILGAPETQMLHFQATAAGETTLKLVYRRPWEEDIAPAGEYSLEVEAIGPFTQPAPLPMTTESSTRSQPSIDLGDEPQLGLPSSFNWCGQGYCTPVRDQGICGSCWAFSTVGPLESNILYHDGMTRDLSEQYLLSCNTDGWDCIGGYFAHDYHEWKIPPGEPDAGAVYEADFPYVGQVVYCNPPHTHHEKIADWDFVGSPGGIPSVAAIKQAILDYGPVSVAVCSKPASAFNNYSGGIYEANECTAVNHAVVLVGWDDAQGTSGIWYLRNSWGPAWGEGGYMRIGYGINSVGYGANYVVYYPSCYDLETTVYPVGAGTIVADPSPSCDGGGYEPDTEVGLTANANPGWTFSRWGGDGLGASNPFTITMDSDKSIGAHFICEGCSLRTNAPLAMKNYEHQPSGWMTIFKENFEGAFPGPWDVFDNRSGYGEYFWGQRDCHPFEGRYSGWAVGAGTNGSSLFCGDDYPNNADSWMIYGPFSLEGATAADLQFKQWLDTELYDDRVCRGASTDGLDFEGWCASGYSVGWVDAALDLGDFLGEPEVWIAMVFDSDESINYAEGAYVDEVVLRKYVSPSGQPPPSEGTTPSSPHGVQLTEEPMMATRRR